MTADRLAAIYAAAFADTRGWSAAEIRVLLDQSGVTLCTHDQAFALLRVTLDEAELLTIATHPDSQRQGLATALLARTEVAAVDQGATQIFLEVAQNNRAARALYEGAGYTSVGERPGYYRQPGKSPVTAIVMRKQLIAEQFG